MPARFDAAEPNVSLSRHCRDIGGATRLRAEMLVGRPDATPAF
jgi:hypothetical protein